MQYIIDAPPRTGKSQYMIYLIDQFTKKYPNRHIVTNIIGINYPGVISVNGTLHNPVDWRDFPNGTIFIYDEAHEHPAFSKDDLMKDLIVDTRELDGIISKISNAIFDEQVLYYIDQYFKFNEYDQDQISEIKAVILRDKKLPLDFKKLIFDDINKRKKLMLIKKKEQILDIGRSLTLHGHFGFDIYLITQDIARLNPATIAASSKHLKLRRLFGWPMMLIYEYAEVQKYFTGTTRSNAISIKWFFYKPYLYKYYISSEEHNVPKSYPTMIIFMLLCVVGLFGWGFLKLKSANAFGLFGEKVEANAVDEKSNSNTQSTTKTDPAKAIADPDCEDIKNNHLEKCIAYNKKKIDELNKSVREANSYYVTYDPTKPYDTQISSDYEATAKPVFSGCVKYNGKYYAYTQQGTKLEASPSVCRRLIDEGDRPFNYFANQNQGMNNNAQFNNQGNISNRVQQNPKSNIPQQMNYQNNYVDPHLEAKVVSGANGS